MSPQARRVASAIRMAVPVALLAIIFSRIDVRLLLDALTGVDMRIAVYSLLVGYVAPILLCSWRWQIVLRSFYGVEVPYGTLLKRFWMGMFVGYVVPGGVGADIYRVASMRSERGGFRLHAAAVVGEKILVILANGLLLLLFYPLVAGDVTGGPQAARVIRGAYALGVGSVALLAMIAVLNSSPGARLRAFTLGLLTSAINAVTAKARQHDHDSGSPPAEDVISPFFHWRSQVVVLLLAAAGQILVSYGGRLLLLSVGVDLPLAVHIFVWTLVFFVFFLPISVGNFGVREASFIIFLGLFGTSREQALASSVVSLASVLVTVAMGGIIYLGHAIGRGKG